MSKFSTEELSLVQKTLADNKIGEDLALSALCDAVTKLRDENAKLIEQVKAKDIELSAIPKEKPVDRDIMLARAELHGERVQLLVDRGTISKHYGDKLKSLVKSDKGDPNVLLLSREPGQSSVADLILSLISEFQPGVNPTPKSGIQELSRQSPTDPNLQQPVGDVKENPLVKMAY